MNNIEVANLKSVIWWAKLMDKTRIDNGSYENKMSDWEQILEQLTRTKTSAK